ncbi:hypothetical protein CC2G_000144 [Coprinopsis cinerea AmutBmut pab1-1]|nr:hypothetical protein CC2G_000144 [Coprinopsis cinerea AmutBmut pab1-1]
MVSLPQDKVGHNSLGLKRCVALPLSCRAFYHAAMACACSKGVDLDSGMSEDSIARQCTSAKSQWYSRAIRCDSPGSRYWSLPFPFPFLKKGQRAPLNGTFQLLEGVGGHANLPCLVFRWLWWLAEGDVLYRADVDIVLIITGGRSAGFGSSSPAPYALTTRFPAMLVHTVLLGTRTAHLWPVLAHEPFHLLGSAHFSGSIFPAKLCSQNLIEDEAVVLLKHNGLRGIVYRLGLEVCRAVVTATEVGEGEISCPSCVMVPTHQLGHMEKLHDHPSSLSHLTYRTTVEPEGGCAASTQGWQNIVG